MVTNLSGTEVESQPLGLDYRASLLPCVSYLPIPTSAILAFLWWPYKALYLPTTTPPLCPSRS